MSDAWYVAEPDGETWGPYSFQDLLRAAAANNHLIELAVAAGADAIVSSNIRDLRRSELSFSTLQILTPSQFLKTIRHP